MTLRRLNPEGPVPVIDRNDDSGARQVRAIVLGERGLFLEVLIDAIRTTGITTWWADWDAPTALLDDITAQSADLVVIHLGAAGYTHEARDLIGRLASHQVLAIALDRAASPPAGCSWIEAGALWAVNPASAGLDELTAAIHAAAGHRGATRRERHRGVLARRAWTAVVDRSSAAESSILTMHSGGAAGEDAVNGNGSAFRFDGDPSHRLTGGDEGRHI